MQKWLIGFGVAVVAGALGVGAAYGGSELLKTYRPELVQAARSNRGPDAWEAGFPMMDSGTALCDPDDRDGIREQMRDRMQEFLEQRRGRTGDQDGSQIRPPEIK